MTNNSRKAAAWTTCVCLGILSSATRLDAQVARTGENFVIGPVGCAGGAILCDAVWVVRYETTGRLAGAFGNGAFQRAAFVSPVPSPPWAPNVAGVRQWIGASATGTLPAADASGNANYRYFFQTEYGGPATTLSLGLGWADHLVGAFVGPLVVGANGTFSGATSVLDVAPYAGQGGFCGAGGALGAGAFPECVVNVTLTGLVAPTTLTFVLDGDGTTDAFFLGAPRSAPPTAVPEPTALALLGAGLLGTALVARRRKRWPGGAAGRPA